MKQRMKPSQPVAIPRSSTWVPSTWVAPENRDTAWWIFNQLFHCRVQRIQTLSMDEMKEYGTPTSGDPNFDAQMRNERIDRMLTIAQMIEYWEQGITVGISNEKDTKQIYEYIAAHLNAWKYRLQTELNNRGAPLEDLVKLDKFASVVYRHAKFHFTQEFVDSILHRKVAESRINRANLEKAYQPKVTTINEQGQEEVDHEKELAEKYPDRVSMADAFKRGQSAGGVTNFRWGNK